MTDHIPTNNNVPVELSHAELAQVAGGGTNRLVPASRTAALHSPVMEFSKPLGVELLAPPSFASCPGPQ